MRARIHAHECVGFGTGSWYKLLSKRDEEIEMLRAGDLHDVRERPQTSARVGAVSVMARAKPRPQLTRHKTGIDLTTFGCWHGGKALRATTTGDRAADI